MKLTDAQIEQYQQNGFLAVGSLFSEPEIALLRDETAVLGTPQRKTPGANVYEKKSGNIRQSCASSPYFLAAKEVINQGNTACFVLFLEPPQHRPL